MDGSIMFSPVLEARSQRVRVCAALTHLSPRHHDTVRAKNVSRLYRPVIACTRPEVSLRVSAETAADAIRIFTSGLKPAHSDFAAHAD